MARHPHRTLVPAAPRPRVAAAGAQPDGVPPVLTPGRSAPATSAPDRRRATGGTATRSTAAGRTRALTPEADRPARTAPVPGPTGRGAADEQSARAAARTAPAAPARWVPVGVLPAAPAPTPAHPLPGGTPLAGGSPLEPGTTLPPGTAQGLAPPGAPLPEVRVHTGPAAGRATRLLGADAVTVGRDILVAPGRYDPAGARGRRLLAHELTHVAHQTAGGTVRVQASVEDVLRSTVTADWVHELADPDVDQGIGLLVGQLRELDAGSPVRMAALENLLTLALEADDRGLDSAPAAWRGLQENGGELAGHALLADLESQLDVAATMLAERFRGRSDAAVERLTRMRNRLPFLTAGVAPAMRSRVEATLRVVDELVQIGRVTPDAPPDVEAATTDLLAAGLLARVRQATTTLIAALRAAVEAVGAGAEHSTHRAAVTAKDAYLDAFSQSFTYTVGKAEADLPTTASVPVSEYLSTLVVSPNHWRGHADEWTRFGEAAAAAATEFAALGTPPKLWAARVEERALYLLEHGDAALVALQRAQALHLAFAAIAYSARVRYETYHRYQMHLEDAELDGAFAVLARDALDLLDATGAPDEREMARIQGRLVGRIAQAEERFEQLRDLDTAIEWLGHIVTVLAGIGVMRLGLAVLAREGTWLAGRALAPSAVRFVVGSLLFTGGSTVARAALTGTLPSPGEVGRQAAMDLVTFGLLRGAHVLVGAAYAAQGTRLTTAGLRAGMARAPAVAMHGASFGVLWAWASTLALVQAQGPLDVSTVLTTMARTGARTALDLVVLHHAMRLTETPQTPSTALGTTAGRQWTAIRAEARAVGERLQEWLRSPERDPAAFGDLMRESQGILLRAREVVGRMYELSDAQRAQLDTLVGEQIRLLETLRQGSALGVEQVGDVVWRYRGAVEELETYLGRLQRDGTVESYTARRGGVVEVRFADGRLAWFHPRGSTVPAVVDVPSGVATTSAAVRSAAPDVPDPVRADALVNLRTLPPGQGARVAGALGPPGSSAMVTWLARPDVAAAMRATDPFPTGPRIVAMLGDLPSAVQILALRPVDLQAWWQARPNRSMSVRELADHLRAIQAFRGTLVLDDPLQAAAETARFGASVEGRRLHVSAPSTGPTLRAMPTAGSPTVTPTALADRIEAYLAGRGFAGEVMTEVRVAGQTWVIRVQDGAPVRAWRFGEGRVLMELEEPLDSHVAELRRAVEDAERLATMDRVRATERLARVRPLVERLDALRRTRTPELLELRDLLERAQPDRFAPPPPGLGPVLGPPTRAESLGRRRDAVVARAARLGLARTPAEAPSGAARAAVVAVEALRARNPRGARTPETLAAIEGQADVAEQALDRLATAALDRAVQRFGQDVLTRVRRGSLSHLSDVQVGETLEALRSLRLTPPGATGGAATPDLAEGALRGFLHAAHPPQGTAPVPLDRIIERAPSAAERNRAMDSFGRIVDRTIPGAHDVLRAMVGSRTSWRGGMFALDVLRYHEGTGDVLALEVRESAPDPLRPRANVRVYDLVMRSGERLTFELKDWSRWFEETVRSRTGSDRRSQFERDVLLRTDNLVNLSGLTRLHWLFKGPGPAIDGTTNPVQVHAHIRGVMRGALEDLATEFGLDAPARATLLSTFDGYPRIIEIIDVDPSNAARPVRRLAPDPEP
ncbi:DUF4157 domain-containing protein [uncultured Cellulomonas sp.]|uniref:DUF4157 domain-containing protein n=1 Tax=uncultured Cellulomonas sp. TaxID=189682 RepID=UPI002609433A|nr:DUF4157 domain-containing protein [uncultured Cellulomonas sp.]